MTGGVGSDAGRAPLTLNQPEGLYYAKTRNHFGLARICHPALAVEPRYGELAVRGVKRQD